MGRNAGGTWAKVGNTSVAIDANGKRLSKAQTAAMLASAQPLGSLKHREVTLQLQKGISRYEAVMGVRERNIKVANLSGSFGVTYVNENGSEGIYLNKAFFNRHRNVVEREYRKQYTSGYKNVTNKPIQHTITHELAHATWNTSYSKPKYVAAGNEIKSLYRAWSRDKKKTGYGAYATKNVNEFWAEVVTKGIHGNSDKYTKKAISIAKKYKL